MRNKMTITIKKRSQTGLLIWVLVLLPFGFGLLNELLGFPWTIRYLLDVAWLWLLLIMGLIHAKGKKQGYRLVSLWIILFLIYTVLVYIVEYQSAFYYLWGMRNNFRFFVAFFAFTVFLTPEDVTDLFKLFDVFFWINFAVSIYQYLFLELKGDYLGGVFGAGMGSNGYMNIFFVIVIVKDILFYLENRGKLENCICKCVAALLVAALAEMKFFFAEFVMVIAMAALFTKFTWKKFFVVFGGMAAVLIFSALLSALFPLFEGFFSLDYFVGTGSSDKGYTSSGDLNRLNAIPRINELWLTNSGQRLFGLGLGNCDTSNFSIVNTPFYEAYGDAHYTWLSYAFMYLETGYIGLLFYYGFFVLVYLGIRRIEKRSEGITQTYCRMGRILSILCMIIAVYNSSLRTEAAYMMYFALAVPFAMGREKKKARGIYAEKIVT